jgi:hypothetical protein
MSSFDEIRQSSFSVSIAHRSLAVPYNPRASGQDHLRRASALYLPGMDFRAPQALSAILAALPSLALVSKASNTLDRTEPTLPRSLLSPHAGQTRRAKTRRGCGRTAMVCWGRMRARYASSTASKSMPDDSSVARHGRPPRRKLQLPAPTRHDPARAPHAAPPGQDRAQSSVQVPDGSRRRGGVQIARSKFGPGGCWGLGTDARILWWGDWMRERALWDAAGRQYTHTRDPSAA